MKQSLAIILFVLAGCSSSSKEEAKEQGLKEYYFSNKEFLWGLSDDCDSISSLLNGYAFTIRKSHYAELLQVEVVTGTGEWSNAFSFDEKSLTYDSSSHNHHFYHEDSSKAARCENIHNTIKSKEMLDLFKKFKELKLRHLKHQDRFCWVSFLKPGLSTNHGDIRSGILLNKDEAYSNQHGIVEKIDSGVFLFDTVP